MCIIFYIRTIIVCITLLYYHGTCEVALERELCDTPKYSTFQMDWVVEEIIQEAVLYYIIVLYNMHVLSHCIMKISLVSAMFLEIAL